MKKLSVLVIMLISLTILGQDTTYVLDEVSIIETYRGSGKTPITQKIITQSEIKDGTFGEEIPLFLSGTPSVTSYSDGGHLSGYTYMRLRGIDQTRINFTLNGVPMNEPEDQGFYSSNFPDFLNSMNSIEIQRGVGTTTNGVASYVGSVNFESTNVRDSAYTRLTQSYGSYNSYRSSVEMNSGLLGKWGFYSRISKTGTDGYKDHSGGDGHSYFFSGGYFGENDVVKINAFTGHSANQMAWLGASQDQLDEFGNKYNPNSKNSWDDFNQSFIQLQHMHIFNRNSSLTTTGYYNRLDGNWDLDLNTFGVPNGEMLNYQLCSNFGGLMLNYKYNLSNIRINLGAHGNYYERTHGLANKQFISDHYYINKGIKPSGSAYVKMEFDVNKFTFFSDLQYRVTQFDYVKDEIDPNSAGMDSKTWAFLNPKLGITYSINNQYKLYVSVGQTHREPTRTDMFGGEDNMYYVTPGVTNYVDVKPESVIDYEGGLKINTKNLYLQTNLFYMDFKDEITLAGAIGSYGLPLMVNVDESYRAGLEFDLQYQLSRNFSITNSSSYMNAQINSDGKTFKPVMTPDFIFNQGVEYQIKWFLVGLNFRYLSDRYINLENTESISGSYNLDMKIKVTHKIFDLIVGLNNFTASDKPGNLSYGNGYLDGNTPMYFVDAPRNFYTTLRLNF